ALDLLGTLDDEAGGRPRSQASFARGPAQGIAAASISSSQFDDDGVAGWPMRFSLPWNPFMKEGGASRLFPQRAGDVVLVNTSRSVHAIDAFDGQEVWSLEPEQLGWERGPSRRMNDFDDAVDGKERIVTVAASRGVVVAPLQIPFSFEDSDQYNDLSIIEIIPERRLVALDLETGAPLWNTLPPLDWDGDSGSFAQRMTVVGPPTIVGARVLVPVARLRGRIEMHLGCFDLATGDVLWSAPLVTGQRTLNMFGRANVEFSAPPPVVAGDTVIVSTQLGLVAAVDLFTGETRWNTLYEQVPIMPPQYYSAGMLHNLWRNAPPAVTGDTVVVAPFDGRELFALDVVTGGMLWQIDWKSLNDQAGIASDRGRRRSRGGLNVLLGADERRILLGGYTVASLDFDRGVRYGPPLARAWAWPLDEMLDADTGYPAIDDDSVFVPSGSGVAVLDRETGTERERVAIGRGHLLVADGMLFSSNASFVDARFEWIAMVERARLAVRSEGATGADLDMLVRLLLERAETQLDRGAEVDRALALTGEAESVIDTFESTSDGAHVAGGNEAARRKLQRHRSLMLRVRGERLRGNSEAARSAALRAVELGVSKPKALEALLALHEIERSRDPRARAEILETILASHGASEIEVEARTRGGEWDPSMALRLLLDSVRSGQASSSSRAVRDTMWSDPWERPIVPTAASLLPRVSVERRRTPSSSASASTRRETISGALFSRLQTVEIARTRSNAEAAVSEELSALHGILRHTPSEPLFGTTSGAWASARIRALRALYPDSRALAEIDAEADELLERARGAAGSTGSTVLLEKLPDLYPGSAASRRAAESRIEFALAEGSPREVAKIVVEELSHDWHPGRSSARETRLLLSLAETLGESGNKRLRAGIAANLARYRPDDVVSLPSLGDVRLDDLRARWAVPPATPPSPTSGFDNSVVETKPIAGGFTPAGRGLVEVDGRAMTVCLAASEDTLAALGSGRGGVPLWTRPTFLGVNEHDRRSRISLGDDGLIVAEKRGVIALDPATGEELWTFARPDRQIARIAVSGGVVVVVTEWANGTQEPAEVHGIDAVLGIELWRLGAIAGLYHAEVKVGEGRFALLPTREAKTAVHDLYTGHPVTPITTGRLNVREARAAWIDRGRLVLAFIDGGRMRGARNEIVAFDLDDGSEAWQVDLTRHAGAPHNLFGLIEMPAMAGGETGVVRLAILERIDGPSARMGTLSGSERTLNVLDERLGALNRRPLVTLDAETHLVGVKERLRVKVDSPILIAVREGAGDERPLVSAIDPRRGVLWKQVAARNIVAAGVMHHGPAVVGDDVIAMIVNESFGRRASRTTETRLMFLDGATGRHVESRHLESGPAQAHWRSVVGFGASLAIMGEERMEILE
ncbi:MAG: PQQ-binding-like beta-propeller repeat protein, partial [Planctomycetota bacterium]